MTEEKMMRLSQVARKLNVGLSTITEHLAAKGFEIENNPNSKISIQQFNLLMKEFESSALEKKEASGLTIGKKHTDNIVIDSDKTAEKKTKEEEEEIFIKTVAPTPEKQKNAPAVEPTPAEAVSNEKSEEADLSKVKLQGIKVVGKIDLEEKKKSKKKEEVKESKKAAEKPVEEKVQQAVEPVAEIPKEEVARPEITEPVVAELIPEEELIKAKAETLKGLTVMGKIELPVDKSKKKENKPVASSDADKKEKKNKRKRKRLRIGGPVAGAPETDKAKAKGPKGKPVEKEEISDKVIQDQIKATLAKLSGNKAPVSRAKYRKEKRSAMAEAQEEKLLQEQEDSKILKVTEYISANDLASLMEVSVNDVIKTCLSLGMFVSINQRLDAEAITVIADEFGFTVDFISTEEEEEDEEELDDPSLLSERAPIVTIMGHVDHGKTSLLDYIRKSKIVSREAGGITQHIGAYDVMSSSGKRITFLDTPGHEAFTAMRARGAKITDIVIIVVAADDHVMPQTKEALNHALVAGVPIVIAINKVDKPTANPDKIKEELAKENILVEDWGGKYQCELISAKSGQGITELLDKVLLEAEILDLKANPNKKAVGAIIEASLDKGRGYLATVLVQSGTLKVGDVVVAGAHYGKVKAMTDHTGLRLKEAGPSKPVQVLGLNGAPQAGDKFQVMESEREAREIAGKREQLLREQSIRTKKHITLDEIGRRLAIGNFKELNIIVKGDVDGSVEALSDSLLKLSTEEVQVRIIHKAVGAISESDVLLASASDAVIVGFQVRPSSSARKLAEQEEIEIRLYSIIYDAINDVKDAMEGMLEPKVEEVIIGNIEVREVFKISKVGTVAGCYVTEGHIKRNSNIRLIREGIVVHTGRIDALKRFKEDVGEVKSGYECGLSIQGYNDIRLGDTIEAFEEKEVKRSL
ncbi:MAG: translation initiation factor IF-2 [Cytophagaceae bacterium]